MTKDIKGEKMEERDLEDLVMWLNNNTDWATSRPLIFRGELQKRLEDKFEEFYGVRPGAQAEEE